jgi:SRSO17 transposase
MFKTTTRDNSQAAAQYLCGLMLAKKRNIERMEESVTDSDYEALQHFISESPWNERAVFDRVAAEVDGLLGGTPVCALLIDETSFVKKGQTTNCQVAVYAALSAGDRGCLVDMQLFLPETWVTDAARCDRAGVPSDRRVAQTKLALAVAIVRHQKDLRTRFTHVVADALYGNSAAFRNALADMGLKYMVGIRGNLKIYVDHPHPKPPEKKAGPGRPPQHWQSAQPGIAAEKYVATLTAADWQRCTLRDGTKGPLMVELHARRVWEWDGETSEVRESWLLVRRDPSGELRYALSNESADTPILQLGQIHAQRHWIERQFQDAKQEAGMNEYQVRGWRAWHHHMAMVLIAMLFMLRQRMLHQDHTPLLSCADIRTLLNGLLRRKDRTFDTAMTQLERRHVVRQSDIVRRTQKALRQTGNITK